MQRPITIIIPAYNHADIVCRCIESVKSTVDHRHHVILADDHSPEGGFEHTVKSGIDGAANIRYVRSLRNLGFVATCNQTVDLSDDGTDILLLNSDTVLTEGAVEEMVACLAASDRHGAVFPRSNAATLLTIPQLHEPCDEFREKSYACWKNLSPSLPSFSVIPTGVGFCMLIRRELIRRFGLFDDVYGRGYNEENDFCMRIARYGFSSVMANRAFVFHDDGASFSSGEKMRLEKHNRRILRRRYPEYALAVREYFRSLPAHEYFADLLGCFSPRKKILIDLSTLIPAFNGTSEYALSLVPHLLSLLSEQYDVSILISRHSDQFFRLSSLFPRVLITEDWPSQRFDLVFVPHQVFTMDHLERLHRIALRFIVNMQDVIALRCPAIREKGSAECVRLTARFASGILSVSEASFADFRAWVGSPLREDLLTRVVHHAYPEKKHADCTDPMIPTQSFVFVVGNHYDHKAVKEAVEILPKGLRIVVLGDAIHHAVCRKNDATLIESGKLSDSLIATLYKNASVVIFPSQYEGFGLPFLHAAKEGTPIIAFDSAVARELVSAFDLEHLVTLCTDFRELSVAAGLHRSGKSSKPEMQRTWEQAATETAVFIRQVLERTPDRGLLEERFQVFTLLDSVRQKVARDGFSLRGSLSLVFRSIRKYLGLLQ